MGRLFGKPKRYDVDFIDSGYKGIKGCPTTEAGINKRIQQFYELNKDKIDAAAGDVFASYEAAKLYEDTELHYEGEAETPFESFEAQVRRNMKAGYDVNDSIRMTVNTHEYTSDDLIGSHNFLSGMKHDSMLYNEFRKATGWTQKIETTKMKYEGTGDYGRTYSYTGSKGIVYVAIRYVAGVNAASYTMYNVNDKGERNILFGKH